MDKLYMIGNAHIDPVWLWQWQEGYHEVKATFRSALDRMNEFDDFIFTCACAQYYAWVEDNDPAMFEEIRAQVAEGRWRIVGGMWIQPDMNIPSGESVIRQLLLSQQYFKDRFGAAVKTAYNVDTFGHNGMLPQFFKKAGIENYVWMRPGIHENPEIPEGPMIWESPDGSRVTAYRIYGEYTTAHNMHEKIDLVCDFSERIGRPAMCFYGVGNHGGGPTIENLREIRAYQNEAPRGNAVIHSTPDEYFDRLDQTALPVWKDELQHHASGCYSTHSLTKHRHREAENALLRMETLGVLSERLTGHQLKAAFVDQAWQDLLFNEFHDIMGGCCLEAALEDAAAQLDEAIVIARREENAALQKIAWQIDTHTGDLPVIRSKETDWKFWGVPGQGTPIVVFNPHSFDAEDTVLLRRPVRAVRDEDGRPVPSQLVRAGRTNGEADRFDSVFTASVPAFGYRVYRVCLEDPGDRFDTGLSASETCLENRRLRAEFSSETGELTRLYLKASGQDVLSAPAGIRLRDIEHCDTWAHNVFRFDRPAPLEIRSVKTELTENGPVRAVLRVVTEFNDSTLDQRFILYADADALRIDAKLDMHEHFRMLKLGFPTAFSRNYSEIPGGVIERSMNGDEQPCQRYVVMQGDDAGLAVFNDGKYSYSAEDGELLMTVSNTSLYADHYGQAYRDDSCEFMDQGIQRFSLLLKPYAGSFRDQALYRPAALLNRPMPHIEETYHRGPLPTEYRGLSCDNPAVDISAVKPAERASGYILRLTETSGEGASAHITLPLLDASFDVTLSPWEIRTLLIDGGEIREVPLTEIED